MTIPMCDLSVKRTAWARVPLASDRPLSPKRSRCLCQGGDRLIPFDRGGVTTIEKYSAYRHVASVELERIQLLLRCDLSHLASYFVSAVAGNDFIRTNRANIERKPSFNSCSGNRFN